MTVKEFLEISFDKNDPYQVRPPVVCVDGFSVSVQRGTAFHYCTPRRHCNQYFNVELGYPTELDEIIEGYAESENTTDTVFGWVPIDVVEALIKKHGGLILTQIPEKAKPCVNDVLI